MEEVPLDIKKRIIYVKEINSGIRSLDENIGEIDKNYLNCTIYIPISYNNGAGYLLTGLKEKPADIDSFLRKLMNIQSLPE